MTYIITILIVVSFCALICEYSSKSKEFGCMCCGIAFTCFIIGAVLLFYNDFHITAEDYLNNPAAYRLDTIGTHINVSKISKL